jgi:signal transduction histidine kinase
VKNFPPKEKPRFISLKTRITLLTILLSTVMTGLLGGALVWRAYQALQEQTQQSQLTLAKTLAWQANAGLSRAFQAMQVLAKRPETVNLDKNPLVRELTLVTTVTELVDGFMLMLPDGTIFANSYSGIEPANLPANNFFVDCLHKTYGFNSGIFVDLYKTPLKNRGVVLSTPVFREGKMIGVLFGVIYLPNHTIGNLETMKFGKSGFVYMVNQDGIAIVHPDRNKWLKDMSDKPPVAAFKKNREGVIQFTDEDQDYLAAYATIPTTSWGVIVKQTTDECYGPAYQMLVFMSLFLGFALLISFFLSLALSEKVIKPILELAEMVHRYESGGLDPRSVQTEEPRDEVGVLRRALERMALMIRIRTRERERAYSRTLQAERKMSESERLATLGQFSAGLAHELNNPLAVILGAAQMGRDAKGPKIRYWLDEIYREAERCRRLVLDLLNFAKPIELKIQPLDLAALVEDAWNQTLPESPEYRMIRSQESFRVRGDSDRLKQVFINLFKNSMDAMPRGGEVRVDFKKTAAFTQVTVTDGGTGILKKNIPKLFRPFFTTKAAGTGLGLVIVRSILQAHQGSLTVERGRPRGVKITLRWPQNRKSQGERHAK